MPGVPRGAPMAGDDSPPCHVVPERALDLDHASTRAVERQLDLLVLLAAIRPSKLVDRGVQLSSQVGPDEISRVAVRRPIRAALGRPVPQFEDNGVRYGASLGWPTRRPPSS